MRCRILAIFLLMSCMTLTAQAAGKPNIVYIVADDLGYADLGCQAQSSDVRTPHIDSIAAAGVRFTHGYVTGPVCSPTRAGLITGRYQQRFGHEFNPGPRPVPGVGLPVDQRTLPQALKSAGYVTGMVGKWHLGMEPQFHPQRRGFDEFFGCLSGSHDYNKPGDGRYAILRGDEPVEEIGYLTDTFGAEAAAFVTRHAAGAAAGKPFFLYLSFNAVHAPMQAPQRYLDRFPDVADEKRRTMLAMLAAMDDAVGLLLAKLREFKLEENTLIAFHSDNGGPTSHNASLNTPLSGFKGSLAEGGIRVPFLLQWKTIVPAGKVIDVPVISLDVVATALAAAGSKQPDGITLDGVDLLLFLRGQTQAPPHEMLYWRSGAQWAVRDGRYKLCQVRDEAPRLFDLIADPSEQHDLAQAEPQAVQRLRAAYEKWNATLAQPRWEQRIRPRDTRR